MTIGNIVRIFGLLVVAFTMGNIIYFLREQQEREKELERYRKEVNEKTS